MIGINIKHNIRNPATIITGLNIIINKIVIIDSNIIFPPIHTKQSIGGDT